MGLHGLVKTLMIASLALAALAFFMADRLPGPERLHAALLEDPLQQATREKPFTASVQGIEYRITPRHAYDLHGLVVSLHDSAAWWDYAHKEWNDHLNIADLCVVWGENIRRDIYRAVSYSHTQWECWWAGSSSAAQRFDGTAMSNNHLITDDPAFAKLLRQVRIGDQVRVRGYLADYATFVNGAQTGLRATSVVRTDEGNGACEVVWVRELEILRATNRPWRITLKAALALLVLSLIAWVFLPPRLSD